MPRCHHKVMHRKRVTCELHELFPLDDDKTCHSKDGGSAYSEGQLWEEIMGAWRRVHISVWEFDGNIRPMNSMEDSEKFRCSCKLVPSLPCVHFLGHHLLTSNDSNTSPDCSYFTQASVKNINIYCYIYITCCCLFAQSKM